MKAISRSPIVIREIIGLGEDLSRGVRNIKEVVTFDEEELTEEILSGPRPAPPSPASTPRQAPEEGRRARSHAARSPHGRTPRPKRRTCARPAGSSAARPSIVTRIVRELKYTNAEKKRLLDKVNKTVDVMRTLERQIKLLDAKYDASSPKSCRRSTSASRRTASSISRTSSRTPASPRRAQAHPARDDPGRHGRREGQARAHRGQPSPRRLHRQEVHQPRPAVPRPHSGGQHRPDEGGRQVRVPPRLQVLDLRHLVDSSGHHPRHRRSGPHHPHPGAHDRDHQQAHPHLASAGAGARPRSLLRRDRPPHGHPCREGPQGPQDRAGAHLARDPHRRRGRFAPRRLHRRPHGRLALRRRHLAST